MGSTKPAATKQAGVFRRLLAYSLRYWHYLLIGISAACAVSLIDAAIVWLIRPVINNFHHGMNLWYIQWMPVLFLALCVLRGGANFCASYFVARTARTVVMTFRQLIFDHLQRLPASYFDQRSCGSILSTIIYNVDQVAEATSTSLQILLRDTSYSIFLLVVMLSLSWRLTLLVILVGPLIAYLVMHNGRRLRKLSVRLQHSMGSVTHLAEESIQGYKVVRLFGAQKQSALRFHTAVKQNKQGELKMVVSNSINSIMVMLFASIPIAIALYIATRSSITAGSFIAFIVALLNIQRPIRRLSNMNTDVQRGMAGAGSVFTLLDEPAEEDSGELELTEAIREVAVVDVEFSYPGTHSAVLKGINLTVKQGEMLALVGASGCGKSTLVQLLPRFYDVTSGVININGRPITSYSRQSLRQQIAVVSQDTFLFNGTIRDNLCYALPGQEVPLKKLREAAQFASALEFIEAQADGFDTLIGDNGVLLSGGQKQRLSIARAYLKNASLLILDEATASLDSVAEYDIQQAMDKLVQTRTSIVIAHRLSTIAQANMICVIEQGVVVESGTQQELMQLNGRYAELYRLQSRTAAEDESP